SGCIFGVLGALIAVVLVRRQTLPLPWRRSLLVNLLLLVTLQLVIDWRVEFIDNAAHVGGLMGGFLAGLLLVPGGALGSGALAKGARVIGSGRAAAALAYGALGALASHPATTAARLPLRPFVQAGVALAVPRYWRLSGGDLADPLTSLRALAIEPR